MDRRARQACHASISQYATTAVLMTSIPCQNVDCCWHFKIFFPSFLFVCFAFDGAGGGGSGEWGGGYILMLKKVDFNCIVMMNCLLCLTLFVCVWYAILQLFMYIETFFMNHLFCELYPTAFRPVPVCVSILCGMLVYQCKMSLCVSIERSSCIYQPMRPVHIYTSANCSINFPWHAGVDVY